MLLSVRIIFDTEWWSYYIRHLGRLCDRVLDLDCSKMRQDTFLCVLFSLSLTSLFLVANITSSLKF